MITKKKYNKLLIFTLVVTLFLSVPLFLFSVSNSKKAYADEVDYSFNSSYITVPIPILKFYVTDFSFTEQNHSTSLDFSHYGYQNFTTGSLSFALSCSRDSIKFTNFFTSDFVPYNETFLQNNLGSIIRFGDFSLNTGYHCFNTYSSNNFIFTDFSLGYWAGSQSNIPLYNSLPSDGFYIYLNSRYHSATSFACTGVPFQFHIDNDFNFNVVRREQGSFLTDNLGNHFNYNQFYRLLYYKVSYYDSNNKSMDFYFLYSAIFDSQRSVFMGTPFYFPTTITFNGALNDNSIYQSGFSSGYSDGFNAGVNSVDTSLYYRDGYSNGYNLGLSRGFADASEHQNDYTFYNLIFSVLDAPVNVFKSLLDFEILGFNMLDFFYGLLTTCIALMILKWIFGK